MSGDTKPTTWGDSDETAAHVKHTSPAGTPGVDPLASARPMKSLGSLLDSFREIARTATQVSRTSDSKRPRPRPRTPQSMHMRSSLLELDAVPLEAPSSALISSSHRKTRIRPAGLSAAPSLSILRLQDRIKRATQESPAYTRTGGIHPDHRTESVPLEDSTRGTPSYTCAAPTKGTIDVLAALQNRGRNILHLPSSPLPGWSVLSLESSNMRAERQSSEG
ncbi:hypothetical protein C2E23DRAFT_836054 [Lenzites betulinus]|nr:hypothetical protein C2E23DRAFT_836054 [Lenzites betulinus]